MNSKEVKVCHLCEESIQNFHEDLNQFSIEGGRLIKICGDCTQFFLDWQKKQFIKMFPTKMAKRLMTQ